MERKHWILLAAVVIAVVAVALVMKYYPVWVTLQNVVVLAVGIVLGWTARWAWNRFVKNGDSNQ